MITAEHEQARAGAGASFTDAVALDFCDPQHGLFGLTWLARLPNAGRSRARVVLFADGELVEHLQLEAETTIQEWEEAKLDGVRMHTAVPLERWTLEADGEHGALRLDVESLSAPRAFPDDALSTIGMEQYEQLCRLSGTIDVAGRTYPVRCLGRRLHSWGDLSWDTFDRWRALYAVSGAGRAISVIAALPAGSKGHGAELRAAQSLDDEQAPPFDDVRLSTVYGEDGLPVKVGVELWVPEDDFPRRFGGEAICGMRDASGSHESIVSFFRWSMEGEPAYGCYEVRRNT